MSKLHVINLIQSVRHLELGPCRGSNSVTQPLALGNLEIIDSLVEIGEFLLNMYVIFCPASCTFGTRENFAGF